MKNLNPTGYLDFSWPAITNVDGYFLKVYKNQTLLNTFDVSSNSYRLSGLKEGDTAYTKSYPYLGDNIFPTGMLSEQQSIPVTNFNEQGEGFTLANVTIDGRPTNTLASSSGYYSTGFYDDGNVSIGFDLINPRNGEPLINFSTEPFFSSASHNLLVSETSVLSEDLSSSNYKITDTYSRNLTSEIVVSDLYGSKITGRILLKNEPISIRSINIFNSKKSDGSVDVSIVPSYSKVASSVEAVVRKDGSSTQLIQSGVFSSVSNFSINMPLDTSGVLTLTPYDWLGSGHSFEYSQPLYYSSAEFLDLKYNKINQPRLNIKELDGFLNFSANILENGSSGSYFKFSLDSSNSESFSAQSYLTGSSSSLNSGVDFDFFNQRTGTHADFFLTLNLYRSGSIDLEDSVHLSGTASHPRFTNSGVFIDYAKGSTEIDIRSMPEYTFSGIDLMVSGYNDAAFSVYSGYLYSSNELASTVDFRIVSSMDHSNILDSLTLTTSGLTPSLRISQSNFMNVDGFHVLDFDCTNAPNEICSFYDVYRKKTFSKNSDFIFSGLSGILDFEDYQDHFLMRSYSNRFNEIAAPFSVSRNKIYQSTGYYQTGSSPVGNVFFTGEYESGSYYTYRAVPVNGYGSGIVSEPITLKYTVNQFTNDIDSSLSTAETDIVKLNDESVMIFGNQDIFGEKTFASNVFITGSGFHIFASDPHESTHVATKNYVDQSYDSIRTTYSSLNTGVHLITGSHLYLSNILSSGSIIIDGVSGDFSPSSFFYPIECTGLIFEKTGQASYYIK